MTPDRLYGWFDRTASERPDQTALEVDGTTLTYGELRRLSEVIAAAVLDQFGRRPARIGLLSSRSVFTYAGYLAILRLGACVVPLNPRVPAARNLMITADAALDATVVDDSSGHWRQTYMQETTAGIVDLRGDHGRLMLKRAASGEVIEPVLDESPAGADDAAYIAFTSGSTGRPKGAPVTHRNISAFIRQMLPRFGFEPGCRVSQTFELSFDAALSELFGAWGSGGTLCVPLHHELLDPVPFVSTHRLTHWLGVPAMVSFGIEQTDVSAAAMSSLRCCIMGGEALFKEQARTLRTVAPNAAIFNCFGPTELTLVCTAYELGDEGQWPDTSNGTLPIGDLYPGLEGVLLDENLEIAGDEEGGELCVRGAQRFPGYLDPAENAGRFVAVDGSRVTLFDAAGPLTEAHYYRTGDRVRREHGELVHLGRVDSQLKINGFRVELSEIEVVLRRQHGVKDLVVVAVPTTAGTDLHAFYTGDRIAAAAFAGLSAALPLYMRPARYHHRDSIPVNANGKTDRTRLTAELGA